MAQICNVEFLKKLGTKLSTHAMKCLLPSGPSDKVPWEFRRCSSPRFYHTHQHLGLRTKEGPILRSGIGDINAANKVPWEFRASSQKFYHYSFTSGSRTPYRNSLCSMNGRAQRRHQAVEMHLINGASIA